MTLTTLVHDVGTERVGQPTRAIEVSPVDARGLEADLRQRVQGEVRFDRGSRALYATDGSNYRQVPIAVVVPRDEGDVVETMAACRRYGAPVLGRGGGTSLCGQCCNVAVVLDFSKYMNRIVEIDPQTKRPGSSLVSSWTACTMRPSSFTSPLVPTPRRTATARWAA
jgi:hypothetical protein